MSITIELPGWLDACRPDDALYADAYEGTPAELRALLKTAIAFAFHRWPAADGETRTARASGRSGFRHEESARPVDWALAVLGPGFASPARLLAALVPAVIAGAGRILVVSEAPFAASVCTALELAGLEDSFQLSGEQVSDLYDDLRVLSPEGRVLVFPGEDGTFTEAQETLRSDASWDDLPCLQDPPFPFILSLHAPGSEAEARLRWLHPDAELLHEAAPGLSAVFVPAPSALPGGLVPAFLCGPGMEACWPGPGPEFYLTRSCSAFLFQDSTPETTP